MVMRNKSNGDKNFGFLLGLSLKLCFSSNQANLRYIILCNDKKKMRTLFFFQQSEGSKNKFVLVSFSRQFVVMFFSVLRMDGYEKKLCLK